MLIVAVKGAYGLDKNQENSLKVTNQLPLSHF